MVVIREKCNLCGEISEFVIDDDATLLREAKCSNCGASIRNSDTAGEVLKVFQNRVDSLYELGKMDLGNGLILNTCSSGAIHNALEGSKNYICGEYFENVLGGEYYEGIMSVDLTKAPFPNNSLDVVISEDVFEHVADYKKAMEEIFRILKPGGFHIFTVPIHDGKKTVSRSGKRNVYHGDPNPLSGDGGVIVYTDWGEDIESLVSEFGFDTELKKQHIFYSADEVTDVDSDYDEYSKHVAELIKYFKYNSYVIVCRKPDNGEKVSELSKEWFEKLALNKIILQKNEEIHSLNDEIERRGIHNTELDKQIERNGAIINELNKDVESRNIHLAKLDREIEDKNRKIADKNKEIEGKNKEIEDKNKEIEDKNKEIEDKNKEIEDKNKEIEDKNKEIEGKNREIEDKNYQFDKAINDWNEEKAGLVQIIKNKEGHIELLLEVEREYEREKNTKSYRFALKLRRIFNFFFPKNSRRLFFARILAKTIRHPILMSKMISPKRIKNYFKYAKSEGMEGVNRRYREALDDTRHQMYPAENLKVEKVEKKEGAILKLEDFEKLELPNAKDNPTVSIVIPVYNEFHYTYNCIKAIIEHSGDVNYELIIANDCSTDITTSIEKIVKNVRLVTTKKNVRFLLNCNNAAKSAKGKYILFLNNDTQVQDNWLKPLVDLIESDSKIGMVGSKLVYPDGRLQEAGGILWKDGSAWNYGHLANPEDPEYNYVKEADYISGAAIMIRHDLWKEIGGFDEDLAPAYYEDTDLAFEVRKQGYKVMYQPQSVVVHFEGVSNGTDTGSGLKAYQVTNQKKFYEKWKGVLEKEHFANAENVYLAKDRGQLKKQILVVDHYVPHYDKDAGGRCTYMYLKVFVKLGFKVTFIGDNFYKHEPYTTELNQMGIEVLYGNYYCNNWQEWLKNNLAYFDYVYLQRPHISIKYIDIVKKYSHAKVFYFAHDLHHIREMREYELTGDITKKESAEKWKKIEYELFEKADVGHVVGSYEQGIMQKVFPDKPIRNIPLYIYENVAGNIEKDFSHRRDLLYVGGFGHPPNEDAVLWFAREVFPSVIEKYPDIKWHVVGSKVTEKIQALASNNVIIEGFLRDEDLEKLYRTCRIAIVPLRYGAGVKGKVVEAAYYQIPLITTSIGAEGIDSSLGNMIVVDDANNMIDSICNIYKDFEKLEKMSNAGAELIGRYYNLKEAERVLNLDL